VNTKTKIIQIALKLFSLNGIDKTSMSKIAHEIGITKPAIYHHFKNKEALILGVIDYFDDKMTSWASNQYVECNTAYAKLRKTFESVYFFKNAANFLIGEDLPSNHYTFNELVLVFSRSNSQTANKFAEIFRNTQASIQRTIETGKENGEIIQEIDSKVLALQIHSIVEGMAFLNSADPNLDIRAGSIKVFDQLWNLIKK
jgi:AcrR family transcriptional regulator